MDNVAKQSPDLQDAFDGVMRQAYEISAEVGAEVEAVLEAGTAHPLSLDEARALIKKVFTIIVQRAEERGDRETVSALAPDLDAAVDRVLKSRTPQVGPRKSQRLELKSHNGIDPGPVRPTPHYYGRAVPMNGGFVNTRDITLWEQNIRLDIHLDQFRRTYGREPDAQERLDIMGSKLQLPGITGDDEFAIADLARSIAANGVQRPPVIDLDGTLLDGNRRLAACNYILENDEFDATQKQRAEHVFVWQLSEHATDEDRHTVVVALNFESDHKEPWPHYVKARKVFEEWQALLALETEVPNARRQAQMKREVSLRFALGPETTVVNRYLRMVEWADAFETYHVIDKKRDEYVVKHNASEHFEYFDELSKGARPGSVAYTLIQDDAYKHLVFDLLLEGKFKRWDQIRKLGKIATNADARKYLMEARAASELEDGQDLVDDAITVATQADPKKREVGANSRIESFVDWLEQLPVKSFRDVIEPENLKKLLHALALVEKHVKSSLKDAGAPSG